MCDLVSHACVQPAIDCAALGAECGQVRNSCGKRLNCGACPSGKECNRNTHKCEPCSNVTCADLGFQCGKAWLGCGPFSNETECGTCPSNKVCNPDLKICEAQCTPPPDAVVCQAAGAECGVVTNGCGGLASCGSCPTGKVCGLRAGGNHCDAPEVPDECVAANRECGPLSSVCGPAVDCGTCAAPNTCWPDGKCRAPCVPARTCTSPELQNRCGIGLDAGCPETLDCACPSVLECNANGPGVVGDCQAPSECSAFGANGDAGEKCSNGPSPEFPGAGNNLTCPCVGNGLCMSAGVVVSGPDSGTCCVNTAVCPPSSCGTGVVNTCTGEVIACTCTSPGTFCDNVSQTCVAEKTCGSYGADGGAANPCSNGPTPDFPKNSSTNLACPCAPGGLCNVPNTTILAPPNTKGACCFNTAVCAANECGTVKTNTCTGQSISCNCIGDAHCNNTTNTCVQNNTCAAFTNSDPGSGCSNGPSTSFPRGDGTNLTCPCDSPAQCYSATGAPLPVGSPTPGSCCIPASCPIDSCAAITDQCTLSSIQCACSAGKHCNNTNGTCEANLYCADYQATGAQGQVCSIGPSFSNGDTPPQMLTCPCGSEEMVCSRDGGAVGASNCGTPGNPCPQGNCCLNSSLCINQCNVTLTNTCTGQPIPCSCGVNQYCTNSTDAGVCVDYNTCTDQVPNANGQPGAPCSTNSSPTFPRFPGDLLGLTCECTGGRFCSVAGSPPHRADGGEVGSCCTNTALCLPGQCGITLKNTCTNEDIVCGCAVNTHCEAGTCQPNATCGSYAADGGVGQKCSNGNDPIDFPRFPSDPTGLTCSCLPGSGCYAANGAIATGSTGGTCCVPDVCPPNTCTPIVDHCSGNTINCSCSAGNYCASSVCKPLETCGTFSANGASGQPCSNGASPAFPKGDLTNLTCPCSAPGVCVSGGAEVSGPADGTCCINTAVCAPNTCASVINTCTGAVINCACSAGFHCKSDLAGNFCIADRSCADYNATGQVGAACSSGPSAAFPEGPGGADLTCACSTAAPRPNNLCAGWSASDAGTCTCTPNLPTSCAQNGMSDGCGGTMVSTCGATQVCYQNACCNLPACPPGNSGDACGSFPGCGTSVACGCTLPMTCGAVTPGVCGCVPKTLADCGVNLPPGVTSPNGCGGWVTCPG